MCLVLCSLCLWNFFFPFFAPFSTVGLRGEREEEGRAYAERSRGSIFFRVSVSQRSAGSTIGRVCSAFALARHIIQGGGVCITLCVLCMWECVCVRVYLCKLYACCLYCAIHWAKNHTIYIHNRRRRKIELKKNETISLPDDYWSSCRTFLFNSSACGIVSIPLFFSQFQFFFLLLLSKNKKKSQHVSPLFNRGTRPNWTIREPKKKLGGTNWM